MAEKLYRPLRVDNLYYLNVLYAKQVYSGNNSVVEQ